MLRSVALVAIAALAGLAAPARAADMPDLQEILQPADTVAEFASGWYLRGDIGFRTSDFGSVTATLNLDPTGNTLDNAWMFGGGAGFKAGWFRFDVTGDYMTGARYSGTLTTPGDIATSVEGAVVLANAYLDLGTWYGVTPYVGAGVGGSYLRVQPLTGAAFPDESFYGTQWNLAWAVMAGASYRLSSRLLLDAGYRYLDLGKAHSAEDSLGNIYHINDITSHEVRFGLRYLID